MRPIPDILKARLCTVILITLVFLLPAVAPAQGAMDAPGRQVSPGVSVQGGKRVGGARSVATGGSVGGLSKGLTTYQLDTGSLPSTSEGLSVLIKRPAGVKNWKGPYVALGPGSVTDKPFMDPWDTEYRYTNTTNLTNTGGATRPSFEIRSAGPDGIFDNADDLVING